MKRSRRQQKAEALANVRALVGRLGQLFGEAQWKNGYRTACMNRTPALSQDEDQRIYNHEVDLYSRRSDAAVEFEKAIRAYGRACAAEAREKGKA
jgi:hypothetical protein